MSETKSLHLTVHFEDGQIWAEVDEYPGCFAAGRDMDELKEALAEAIGFYLAEGPEPAQVGALHLEPVNAKTHIPARVELVPC